MAEIWELVDKEGRLTGVFHERGSGIPIPEGLYHLCVEVWVSIRGEQLILTQRHKEKHYSLKWECTGGSVLSTETAIEGAARELGEEVGIVRPVSELIPLGVRLRDDCAVHSFLLRLDELPEISIQKEVVAAYKFVTIAEMESLSEELTDWARESFAMFKEALSARK